MLGKRKASQILFVSLCLTTIIPILVATYLVNPDAFFKDGTVNFTPIIISITAIIVFLGIYLLHRINHSIAKLSENATNLAHGNLADTVVEDAGKKGQTDVSGLAESLNIITEQLIFNVDELESKAILLERSNRELEKLNDRKNEFVSTVTHELRAPLINIKQCASMMVDGSFADNEHERKQSILMIKSNTERLIQLIADILDVTKLNAEQLQVKPVNLQEVIHQATIAIEHWCKSKGITMNVRSFDKETIIYGDFDRGKVTADSENLIYVVRKIF